MAYITLQQHAGDLPRARVVTAHNGDRFISIDVGRTATLLLHGANAKAVASAQEFASILNEAAEEIIAALSAEQQTALEAKQQTVDRALTEFHAAATATKPQTEQAG